MMFKKELVEKLEEYNRIQYKYEGKTVIEINSINYIKLNWKGINLKLDGKKNLILDVVDFRYPNLADYLLSEEQLKKVMKQVEKRFRTSYSDIMAGVICLYSTSELHPSFSGNNDYDEYCNSIATAINRVGVAYINKYGYN